jgi:hypothetical membrane protein
MNQGEASIRISKTLRIVGISGIVLGIATVLCSLLLYIPVYQFSFFETYLSDIGNKPGWSQVIFNSGMLISSPIRYLFLILLVLQLAHFGASRAFAVSALIIGGFVVIGSIGVSAIPFSLNLALHKISALIYFFGVVVLQTLIATQEWRRKLPLILTVSSISVVAVYLIFAVLLSLIGKVEGITRNTPVIWEWLAFCSLMFWLIVHTVFLGRQEK